MEKVNVPEIKIDERVFRALPPTIGLWRDYMAFDRTTNDFPLDQLPNVYADTVARFFGDEITGELLLDKMAFNDITEMFREIGSWLMWVIFSKTPDLNIVEVPEAED